MILRIFGKSNEIFLPKSSVWADFLLTETEAQTRPYSLPESLSFRDRDPHSCPPSVLVDPTSFDGAGHATGHI